MLVPSRLAHFTCGHMIHFALHIVFQLGGSSKPCFDSGHLVLTYQVPCRSQIEGFFKHLSSSHTHTFRMVLEKKPGWWFHFLNFHPYLGKISNLTNIFQMG